MAGRSGTASNRRKPTKTAALPKTPSSARADGAADDRVIDAALSIASRDGWRGASLAAIAAEAGVGLAALYDRFPDKAAILAGLMRRVDRVMLAAEAADAAEGSPRDRLFDVMMRRFETLQPWRAGIAAIAAAGIDPLSALALVGSWRRTLGGMLEAAGIGADGLAGRLRIAGLAVVYARAFRVWLDDDGADLGKTMAALDRGLAQAERWASALPGQDRPI
ncbi:MAG: TetR family transcriptional regulator [Proteobacteria bacterium]|nr:TetR family transcriptional regulator [Pseudomonadota bacterium]